MAFLPDVRLDSGTAVAGFTAAVTRIDVGGGFYDLSVALQSMDLSMFNSFDLLWGTGDCANDLIWGSVTTNAVDAPPAALLLGFGLFGLIGLRSRAKKFLLNA